MKNREPHHFCGVLILLLALVSLYAWFSYPPARQTKPLPIAIETGIGVEEEPAGEPAPQPAAEQVPTTLKVAP
jgi:hypothetical protein